MASTIIASQIVRKPLAPKSNSSALSTINSKTSSSILRTISSISNNFRYCLIIEFFGSVRIFRKASLSRGSKCVTTGNRPINSGIIPKLFTSCGETYCNKLPSSICSSIAFPNPSAFVFILFVM